MENNYVKGIISMNQTSKKPKCFDRQMYFCHLLNIQNQLLFLPETNKTVYPVTVGFSFYTLK